MARREQSAATMANRRTTGRQLVEAFAEQERQTALNSFGSSLFGIFGTDEKKAAQQQLDFEAAQQAQQAAAQAQLNEVANMEAASGVMAAVQNHPDVRDQSPTAIAQGKASAFQQLQAGISPQQVANNLVQDSPMARAERTRIKEAHELSKELQTNQLAVANEARETVKRQQLVGLRKGGRAVSRVDDMLTVMAQETRLIAPDQAQQFYRSGRARLLLDMKDLFNLGILSETDEDILNDILGPKADAFWSTGTQTQRIEAMRQIRQIYQDTLDDNIFAFNSPFDGDSFIGEKRSFADIMAPLDPDLERLDPDDVLNTKEIPVSGSGDLSPFNAFLQQIGF
jgi:hypothetical protein